MAFTQNTLSKASTGYSHIISGQKWLYLSTTDTLATILSDGYFDDMVSLFAVGETLNVGDLTSERNLIEVVEINPTAPRVKTREFISSGSIPDGSITTPKFANLAVTGPKIGPDAVTTLKLADTSVTNSKIDKLTVGPEQLASDAVETDKIQDGAVTKDKFASNTLSAWTIVNAFEVSTGTLVNNVYNIPGGQIGDRAYGLFSFQTGPILHDIIFSAFNNPNNLAVKYQGVPNVLDRIQIINMRLLP